MLNITIKSTVYLLVGISSLAWLVLAYLGGLNLGEIKDFMSLIPKVVTINLFVIAIFIKWGWKIRFFKGWLVPFPNLNGTWTGYIYSQWVDPKSGEKPAPIPAMLTINQTFTQISCVLHTEEMKSYSRSEGFDIDANKQVKQLAYIYTSKPKLSVHERSNAHDGALVFNVIEKPNAILEGRYWTERKTIGEIKLNYLTHEMLETIPDDFEPHPVTETINRIK